jgi:hypothetical protein
MANYFEIRKSDGVITNFIVWDGVTELGTDTNAVQYVAQNDAPIGINYQWRLVDGEWVAPPVVEETEQEN